MRTTLQRNVRGFATILVAALLGVGAFVGSAHAYNTASYWNKSGTPLTVNGYGSTARTYGYVKIVNGSNGTRLYSYAWNKFTDADNHRAYQSAKSQFNAGSCAGLSATIGYKGVQVGASSSCAREFYDHDSFPRADGLNYTKNNSWVAMPTKSVAVHGGSDRGRARVTVCLDIPVRLDPCSGASYSESDSF